MAQSQSSPIHASSDQASPAPELSAVKARQGRLGQDVFWVLVISVVLAVAALTIAWIWRAPQLAASEANNGKRPALIQTFHSPPSQPVLGATPSPAQPSQDATPSP